MDAREQLRAAHETFSRIGAEAFAERARRELHGHRRDGAQAHGRDARRAHARRRRRSPGSPQQGQHEPGDRRRAVHQPAHRRVPPAQGVHEARHRLAQGAPRGAPGRRAGRGARPRARTRDSHGGGRGPRRRDRVGRPAPTEREPSCAPPSCSSTAPSPSPRAGIRSSIRLLDAGHPVIAVANPLRGLAADAACVSDHVRVHRGPGRARRPLLRRRRHHQRRPRRRRDRRARLRRRLRPGARRELLRAVGRLPRQHARRRAAGRSRAATARPT